MIASLILRIALWAICLHNGAWHFGDADYYLRSAQSVCNGGWGADGFRAPLLPWFACLMMPFGGVATVLLVQTLAFLGVGLWIQKKWGVRSAALWLFDPGLLFYSCTFLSEPLFTLSLFIFAILLRSVPKGKPYLLGLMTALVLLGRSNGFVVVLFAYLIVILPNWYKKSFSTRFVVITTALAAVLVAPRIYWNGTHFGSWGISTQGAALTKDMAGAIDSYGQGLDFVEGQAKWAREHPNATTMDALEVYRTKWKTALWLTFKGIARTLVGHLNVEWVSLFTGRPPIGPGWFKERGDPYWTGWRAVLWAGPVIIMMVYYLALYSFAGIRVARQWSQDKLYWSWIVLTCGALAASPLIVGDARFRVPIVALLVIAFKKNRE